MNDRELRGALANVLCNASNFPDKAQSRILGQDLGPLIDKTTDVILESEWLSGVIREAKAEQREVDARIAYMAHYAAECSTDGPLGPGMRARSDAAREIAAAIRAGGTDE